MTTNIDVSDGLFNGARGVLRKFECGTLNTTKERVPTVAWMEFSETRVGATKRQLNRHRYNRPDIQNHWVPIERVSKPLSKSFVYAGLQLTRNQIPLLGANAITIHKSQGSSMPLVVVGTRKPLRRDALYVACSRATSLAGLYIDGKFKPPEHPGENDHVSMEIETLRKRPVQFSFRFPPDCRQQNKLYFHNVENFNCYKEDVISDFNILSCNVLAFVEPRIREDVRLGIPGFNCVSKGYCHGGGVGDSAGHILYKRSGKLT